MGARYDGDTNKLMTITLVFFKEVEAYLLFPRQPMDLVYRKLHS